MLFNSAASPAVPAVLLRMNCVHWTGRRRQDSKTVKQLDCYCRIAAKLVMVCLQSFARGPSRQSWAGNTARGQLHS